MSNIREFFENQKILVTGSNGFVGRNLVEELSKLPCKIYCLDHSTINKNEGIEYFACDVTDREQLKEVLEKIQPNYIFHLAAIVSAARDYSLFLDMLNIHVKSLYNFFDILKDNTQLKLLLNMGSTEEYGDYAGAPFKEDFFEKSSSPYAVTKTAGVHFAYMIGKNENFPVISIRPGVLYGNYQSEDKFIPYVKRNLLEGKDLNVTLCDQERDLIHVTTFVDILLKLIASEKYDLGEIYNISSGQSVKLRDIVELAKYDLSSKSKINYGAIEYRTNEIMEFKISIDKVGEILKEDSVDNLENFRSFFKK